MNIRTSDLQSAYAVKSGLGSTLIASLPRLFCEGETHRIIIEAGGLLGDGFFVVDAAALGSSIYVVDAKEFPKNFDITVDYGPMFPLLRVGYTVVLLPEQPMKPRSNDDRLLFFDTQYLNKGNLENRPGGEVRKLSEQVDSDISMIWRYNIDALPDQTIRFYVDRSVPKRWRPFFRQLGLGLIRDSYKTHRRLIEVLETLRYFEILEISPESNTFYMILTPKEGYRGVERCLHIDRATECGEGHFA